MLCRAGYSLEDLGDLAPLPVIRAQAQAPNMKNLDEAAGWARQVMPIAETLLHDGALPVWLGGDHGISLGTVAGAAAYAKAVGRPLFVLWIDAHPDFNSFATSPSGHMHGVPVAFFCGLPGFEPVLGMPLAAPVDPANLLMLGIRSVDPLEAELLSAHGVRAHGIRAMRRFGIAALLGPFLKRVAEVNGLLHVSFDVDFLDPLVAPAVGTPVAHGGTLAEAHQIMALVRRSGLMRSLDIVELNPLLDAGGGTTKLVVEIAATLFGGEIFNQARPPRWPVQNLQARS
jgi:arginase